MATTLTLDHLDVRADAAVGPRSFVPPDGRLGNRTARLSHLDPRPLWREDSAALSPWRSPTFWAAYALVAPVAGMARLLKR